MGAAASGRDCRPWQRQRRGLATQAGEGPKAGEAASGEEPRQPQETQEPQRGSTAPMGEPAASVDDTGESPRELLLREHEELQAKVKAEKHELLLALADFENNKKRHNRDREARKRNALLKFATSVVEVYDQFDALAHLEDKAKHLSEACQRLQEGIALTRDLYRTNLEKFDVLPLEPAPGEPFVPARHESVGPVEAPKLPANSVAEVVKPGWVFEPNSAKPVVLRKAQVKVARHGPDTPPSLEQGH